MRVKDSEVAEQSQASNGGGIAVGIIMIILGIAAIARPLYATIASTIAFGWLFILAGIVQIVYALWVSWCWTSGLESAAGNSLPHWRLLSGIPSDFGCDRVYTCAGSNDLLSQCASGEYGIPNPSCVRMDLGFSQWHSRNHTRNFYLVELSLQRRLDYRALGRY